MKVTGEGIKSESSIDIPIDIQVADTIEIPVFDITPEVEEKRQKFNRAKVKRETQRKIKEELSYSKEDDFWR